MTTPPSKTGLALKDGLPLKLFALVFGAVLGLAFLKFPNPSVVEHLVVKPSGVWEWLLTAWPVHCGHVLLVLVGIAGVALMRWPTNVTKLLALLPVIWLAWVGLSYTGSIDAQVSGPALVHFAACVGCFYLGLLVVGRLKQAGFFLAGLMAAFAVVLITGWQQHFGGLEQSRLYFLTYVYPTLPKVDPELLKRMEKGRIFATLFYPNSLAGAVLLLTPLLLGVIADTRNRLTVGARWLLAGIVGAGAAGCLIWSGSKGGWLLALAMAVVAWLRLPVRRPIKIAVVLVLLVGGMAGFLARYHAFFQRGATSVVARFDYWRAAGQNVAAHPWLGSGPGTFAIVYKQLKPPEAEMARLVHNDYLQQASDSGVVAGVIFLTIVGGILVGTRRVWQQGGWMLFGLWLGLAGFAAQALAEFGFYVPATAWCWFALAGWLVASVGLRFDKRATAT